MKRRKEKNPITILREYRRACQKTAKNSSRWDTRIRAQARVDAYTTAIGVLRRLQDDECSPH